MYDVAPKTVFRARKRFIFARVRLDGRSRPLTGWLLALALLLSAAGLPAIPSPAVASVVQRHHVAPVSQQALARFAHINALARQIQRRYRQAFSHAHTPAQARKVAREMNRAVTRMFRQQGMSVARYRRVRRYLMQEALNAPPQPIVVAGNTTPDGSGS